MKQKPRYPLEIPGDEKGIIPFSQQLVEDCRISSGLRSAFCRWISAIVALGRDQGKRSLLNLMYSQLDSFASNLFSPSHMNFTMGFVNKYPKNILDRADVAAGIVTNHWKESNLDMLFGLGVFEAGKLGTCILKQWAEEDGGAISYHARLVMPWAFGVYREDETELDNQSALCETVHLTMPEVWRRIYHLPERGKLYGRIKSHATKGQSGEEFNSFVHQVLSTSVLQTSGAGIPKPGGVVSVSNDAGYAVMGAEIGVDLVKMHEIWVQAPNDYVTIQFIEPDVIVAPRYAHKNLLVPGNAESGLHPYTKIQPNPRAGYFWGRSEIEEQIQPQNFLSDTADDLQKLAGLQVDKILGLIGYEGDPAEFRDQMHDSGFVNLPQGGSINDLTPKIPSEMLPIMNFIIEFIHMVGGRPPVLQGQGDQGVRSEAHAAQLIKTGSPRLRDASLLIERQCAQAADLTYRLKRAKDDKYYWTKGEKIVDAEESKFLLTDIPDDGKINVDSHSSSPIFEDEKKELIAFGMKTGICDGHYAIDNLPFPDKDLLHARLTEREQRQQQTMEEFKKNNPELWEKLVAKSAGGRH
jgi:hypothetical protein